MTTSTTILQELTRVPRIAYFSMEVALRSEIPTYSGGLGVLAGDTLRSAADLELPLVAVTLVSRAGYLQQRIDERGMQCDEPQPWDPALYAQEMPAKVSVPIAGREVWIGAWLYLVSSQRSGGSIPVLLLDTDQPSNAREDRDITHRLYGGDDVYRLKQEIVLGIGGVRMLQALGFSVRKYHMNEGHSALLAVELVRCAAYPAEDVQPGEPLWDVPRVRDQCIFTTHTPVDAGHDVFSYELVRRVLGDELDFDELKKLAGADALNMTRLALNASEYVNGVAERHAETSRKMFPGYRVAAVTNGVHPFTWTHPAFARLYDRRLGAWCHEPAALVRIDQVDDASLLAAHDAAKNDLVQVVAERTAGRRLDPATLILGFARRMTAYKRPALLFSDVARLVRIAKDTPLSIVLAGKAHPKDEPGKRIIAELLRLARELDGRGVNVVFVPDYDMDLARALVAGVDVWVNTPERPLEASGTSGMKAALNGVPSLSVLDGWWMEGCIEGVTGWAVGDAGPAGSDGAALYDKLEHAVVPAWRAGGATWGALMKGAIGKNGSFFNSQRMMMRYLAEAYIK